MKATKILKVVGIIGAIIAGLLIFSYFWSRNKPLIFRGYNKKIETGGELEKKYLQNGDQKTEVASVKTDLPIEKYTIYFPSELKTAESKYPMVLMVNGTDVQATRFKPMMEQIASWGFIVVGTQDRGAGTGETTMETLEFMLGENQDASSPLYNKIDLANIGITGYSQGGAGAFNAVTAFENSGYFKTIVPLSPACEPTSESLGYPYDISKVTIPTLLLAGTSGEFETETVIPFSEMTIMYDKIKAPKIMARRIGMDHDDMMYKAGGYLTAWMMWQLKGDEEAAKAFIGDDPEIMKNPLYQDQRNDYKVE